MQQLYVTEDVTFVAAFLRDAVGGRGASPPTCGGRWRRAACRPSVYTYLDYDVNPYYVGTMQFLESLVGFIGILIIAVVVLGIVNAATLTVYERTRELGTFRALGYTRRQVSRLLVREVLLLSLDRDGGRPRARVRASRGGQRREHPIQPARCAGDHAADGDAEPARGGRRGAGDAAAQPAWRRGWWCGGACASAWRIC